MDLVVKFYPVAVEFRHYESLTLLGDFRNSLVACYRPRSNDRSELPAQASIDPLPCAWREKTNIALPSTPSYQRPGRAGPFVQIVRTKIPSRLSCPLISRECLLGQCRRSAASIPPTRIHDSLSHPDFLQTPAVAGFGPERSQQRTGPHSADRERSRYHRDIGYSRCSR